MSEKHPRDERERFEDLAKPLLQVSREELEERKDKDDRERKKRKRPKKP